MGIVRITATSRWFKRAAELTKSHKQLSRELLRAATRPGLTAQIKGEGEAEILADALPNDDRAQGALREIRELIAYEDTVPRARDIALGNAEARWVTRQREENSEHST
jgi:hypothetical protein